MREITSNEVKDPVQLRRYLSELGRMVQEQMMQPQPAPQIITAEQPPPLPDQLLADLQLTQIARVHNFEGDDAAPTTADNLAKGYTVGSRWYRPGLGTPEIYECIYSSNSTATWVQVY